MLYLMYDAAFPPGKPYPNASAVAGYLGGNTPHVWTAAQWNAASDNGNVRMLPIWVGYLEDDPAGHAIEAATVAKNLGWRAHAPEPFRRYICLDKETQADDAWQAAFAEQLHAEGFDCLDYRSLGVIVSDPTPIDADNWVADWGVPVNMVIQPRTHAFQFVAGLSWDGTQVDLSVIDQHGFDKLGRGARRV